MENKDLIRFEIKENIGLIQFNRPDKYNSMLREIALPFLKYLDECATNDEIRAVYITGSGKAFCAGQDLQEAMDPTNGLDMERLVTEHFNPLALKIYNLEKPVVAAVNGVAAGAGANLALVCDIVVAKESASFIQAFSAIGLVPDTGGTYTLPRLIGFQKALAITMLGDKIKAKEAERLGMIYKYFPDEEFDVASWAIAKKLAKMPTQGLAMTKLAYNKGLCNSFEQQLAVEKEYQIKAGNTEDHQEGLNAFIEKRKPVFKGK